MKKIFIFFATTIVYTILSSQAPAIQWQKNYGGTNSDVANIIQKTNDGGYIFAGSNSSNNGDATEMKGIYDIWVVKINSVGSIQWQKSVGGESYDYPKEIKQTNDGGYIVIGSTESITGDFTGNHGKSDVCVVKFDSTGIVQWKKTYGGSSYDDGYDILQTIDGGYIIAGNTTSNDGDLIGNHDSGDIWLIKIDNTGNMQWQKIYGGTTGDDQARTIKQTNDGGFILGGETTSTNGDVTLNHGYYDYWVVKLSSTGNIEWQKTYGGDEQDSLNTLILTNDSGYILSGLSSSNNDDVTGNHGGGDVWIVKINNLGNIEWQKCLGGTKTDLGYEVIQANDGNYLIAAWSESNDGDVMGNHGSMDGWLVKLSNLGDIQWQKTFGGSGYDWVQSIQQTTDGYIVAGYNGSVGDAWVIKLGLDDLATTDFRKNKTLTIFPNPVKDKFVINTNDKIENVEIYSTTGQLLKTTKFKEIDIANFPKGNYIINIRTNQGNLNKKIIKE